MNIRSIPVQEIHLAGGLGMAEVAFCIGNLCPASVETEKLKHWVT